MAWEDTSGDREELPGLFMETLLEKKENKVLKGKNRWRRRRHMISMWESGGGGGASQAIVVVHLRIVHLATIPKWEEMGPISTKINNIEDAEIERLSSTVHTYRYRGSQSWCGPGLLLHHLQDHWNFHIAQTTNT